MDGNYTPPRPRSQRPQKVNKNTTTTSKEDDNDSGENVHEDDEEYTFAEVYNKSFYFYFIY
jgi:hypothetical protein